MPVFLIVRSMAFADGIPIPAYQIATRQSVGGRVWYDVGATTGPNDPVDLVTAGKRLDALEKQLDDGLVFVAKTISEWLNTLLEFVNKAEWDADFRQELIDFIEKEQLALPTIATREISLVEARRRMMEKVDEGVECPCCGRLVKLYRRKLHAEMAAFLCRLSRRYVDERRYYSTREICPALTKSATDGSYLVLWDLIENQPSENGSGGKAGMYKPTEYGLDFVFGRTTVKSHVHLLCGEVVGFSDDYIHIKEALGSRFNYDELMGRKE